MYSSRQLQKAALDFPSHLLQLQWASATLISLETEALRHGAPLSMKHPLVSPLVEGLLSPSHLTSQAVCSVLLSAASHRWVDQEDLLASLLTQLPATKHHTPSVSTLGRLLEAHLTQGGCPYSLRTNTHPFISVLNSRPECGMSIINEVIRLLQTKEHISVLALMEPFVKYVLLHPSPSPELALLGTHLHSELISAASQKGVAALATLRLLSRLLPLQPTGTDQQLLTVVSRARALVVGLGGERHSWPRDGTGEAPESQGVLTSLLDSCLSLCCELTSRGLPTLGLLESVEAFLAVGEVSTAGHHYMILAWLLLASPSFHPAPTACLLRLCKVLSPDPTFLQLLAFPLVQLLSQPTVPALVSCGLASANQQTASALLHQIEQDACATTTHPLPPPSTPPLGTPHYSLLTSAALTYREIYLSEHKTVVWLQHLGVWLGECQPTPPVRLDHIVLVLSALALRQHEGEMFRLLLEAFAAVARADPPTWPQPIVRTAKPLATVRTLQPLLPQRPHMQQPDGCSRDQYALSGLRNRSSSGWKIPAQEFSEASSLLPFLLHLQSIPHSPESVLALLYSIPSLATHKLAIGGVINILQVLRGNPSLLAMATRLMGKAWELQDHIFPHLQEFLSYSLPPSTVTMVTREVMLARAAVIRDICCKRAEQHGENMLGFISGIINQSHDPVAVAMVIEGLVALCKAEITDITTLWGVLGRKLGANKSPAVMAAVCELLGLACTLSGEKQSHKAFKTTALRQLWSSVFSKNHHICSAALRALSEFEPEDFLVEHLPEDVRNLSFVVVQLGIIAQEASHDASPDLETTIPLAGIQCVELCQLLPAASLPSYTRFLIKVLNTELQGISRGMVYSALREAQVPGVLQRALSAIPEKLQNLCATHCSQDGPDGLITATFMSVYEAPRVGGARPGRELGRHAVGGAAQQLWTKLESFLREGKLWVELSEDSFTGLACCSVASNWKQFMSRLLQAFSKARLSETCPVSVLEDPSNPALLEKQTEACYWARRQIVEKLVQFLRTSPDAGANVLLALVGMVCSPDPFAGSSHVMDSGQLDEWSQEVLLQTMVESLVALLDTPDHHLPNHSTLKLLFQLLRESSSPLLVPAMIHCVPVLAEGGLSQEGYFPEKMRSTLVELAGTLFAIFSRSPQWYTAVSLSRLLTATLSICPEMKGVLNSMIPYLEAALQTDSLDLLSLTAPFVSVLCVVVEKQEMGQQLLSQLHSTLSSLPPSHSPTSSTQLASLHLSSALSAVFLTGLLSHEEALMHISVLAELATKAPTVCAYHVALGFALRTMASAGHPSILPLANSIAVKWIQELNSETSDPFQVLPVLWGLSGLLGVNPVAATVPWQPEGAIPITFLETLLPLVATALENFASSSNHGVCSASVWLMGEMYHCVSETLSHLEKVPQNYGYLPDTSCLRTLHAVLLTVSSLSQGAQSKIADSLLEALGSSETPLPPVDFSSVLIPFCRNKELQSSCIDCLLHNCKETQGFRMLASHYCDVRVFTSLKMEQQCKMAENLPSLVASLQDPLRSMFIHLLCTLSLQTLHQSEVLFEAFLKGLLLCFQLVSPGSDCKPLLTAIVSELYRGLSSSQSTLSVASPTVLQNLAACLRHGEATVPSMASHSSQQLFMAECLQHIVHCCWVMSGDVIFSTLQSSIEWALNNADSDTYSGLALQVFDWVLKTVQQCCSPEHPKSLLHCSSLLHTLLAWTRTTKPSARTMNAILALTCAALTSSKSALTIHLHLDTPVWHHTPHHGTIFVPPDSAKLREKLCQCLSEWLGLADANLQESLFGCFVGLKSCKEYHKPLIWTSVAHVL